MENLLPNFKFAKQDEFEIQQKILLKTRSEVDALKQRVEALEAVIESLNQQKMDQAEGTSRQHGKINVGFGCLAALWRSDLSWWRCTIFKGI